MKNQCRVSPWQSHSIDDMQLELALVLGQLYYTAQPFCGLFHGPVVHRRSLPAAPQLNHRDVLIIAMKCSLTIVSTTSIFQLITKKLYKLNNQNKHKAN